MDRLSTLPDNVICHVLSFLPTKLSVATSVLAKRWKFLWAHVPNLDFSTSQFHIHRIKETKTSDISDVIHKVMSLHESPTINSFRFTHEHKCSDEDLEEWIDDVTARNVRKIYILLDYQVSLPPCLFTCETLVDLDLTKLENADNLEDLAIICIIEEDPKNWVDPKQVPTCVTSHLRTVSISEFGCTEPDFDMVRYLLWNAIVMKRMEIRPANHRSDLKEKFEELKKISLSERGSEAIKLTVH